MSKARFDKLTQNHQWVFRHYINLILTQRRSITLSELPYYRPLISCIDDAAFIEIYTSMPNAPQLPHNWIIIHHSLKTDIANKRIPQNLQTNSQMLSIQPHLENLLSATRTYLNSLKITPLPTWRTPQSPLSPQEELSPSDTPTLSSQSPQFRDFPSTFSLPSSLPYQPHNETLNQAQPPNQTWKKRVSQEGRATKRLKTLSEEENLKTLPEENIDELLNSWLYLSDISPPNSIEATPHAVTTIRPNWLSIVLNPEEQETYQKGNTP